MPPKPYTKALTMAKSPMRMPARKQTAPHAGALTGATPGRADAVDASVPDGCYIIPADIVSALGDGNTASGFEHLARMFPEQRADGGATVPCKLSDGEFMVFPADVQKYGGPDAFDEWIVGVRRADIKRRQELPGPVTE